VIVGYFLFGGYIDESKNMEYIENKKKKIGAFHLERRELKPKARVRMNKDIITLKLQPECL
jgi:hypothetical protein